MTTEIIYTTIELDDNAQRKPILSSTHDNLVLVDEELLNELYNQLPGGNINDLKNSINVEVDLSNTKEDIINRVEKILNFYKSIDLIKKYFENTAKNQTEYEESIEAPTI